MQQIEQQLNRQKQMLDEQESKQLWEQQEQMLKQSEVVAKVEEPVLDDIEISQSNLQKSFRPQKNSIQVELEDPKTIQALKPFDYTKLDPNLKNQLLEFERDDLEEKTVGKTSGKQSSKVTFQLSDTSESGKDASIGKKSSHGATALEELCMGPTDQAKDRIIVN